MWGMMFGLAILKLYVYYLNKKAAPVSVNVFSWISKIENDTLLFFFGILAAVGGLHFLGFLEYFTALYSQFGATAVNIGVGFLSAIVDNVPVMSAVLKADPNMGADAQAQWMLVTMTAGIGGSLISFGSAAGVGVMGKLHGIYTFGAHMKYAWTVLVGYLISLIIWFVQFEMLGFY
jgi:Na+/H+ antiporter NhaD/arsenite permease-like protein